MATRRDTGFADDVTHVDESVHDIVTPSGNIRSVPETIPATRSRGFFSFWRNTTPEPQAARSTEPPPGASVRVDEEVTLSVGGNEMPAGSVARNTARQSTVNDFLLEDGSGPTRQISGPSMSVSGPMFTPELAHGSGPSKLPMSACAMQAVSRTSCESTDTDDTASQAEMRSLQKNIRKIERKIQALSVNKKGQWRSTVNDSLRVHTGHSSATESHKSNRNNRPRTAANAGKEGERPEGIPASKKATEVRSKAQTRVERDPLVDRVGVGNSSATPDLTAGSVSGGGKARELVQPVASESVDGRNGCSGTVRPQSIMRKPIKLIQYDGVRIPFETFMAKLRNAELHNGWDEAEKCAHLRDALVEDAGQILWELSPEASSEEVVEQLRIRFGNANNAERYRAELSVRKRGIGESTQSVYTDIRRLMSLAFPKQRGEMYEAIGKDYFLTALNDPALRMRVLDRQPKTLDETYSLVVQMEACSKAMEPGVAAVAAESSCEAEKKRVRIVSPVRESEADRRIRALEETIEQQKQEIQNIKHQSAKSQSNKNNRSGQSNRPGGKPNVNMQQTDNPYMHTVYVPVPNVGQAVPNGYVYMGQCGNTSGTPVGPPIGHPMGSSQGVVPPQTTQNADRVGQQGANNPPQPQNYQGSYGGGHRGGYSGGYRRDYRGIYRRGGRPSPGLRIPSDMCARCHERGHWKHECPHTGYRPAYDFSTVGNEDEQPEAEPQVQVSQVPGRVNMVPSSPSSAVYIDIVIKGHTMQAMLDTGCQVCLCPMRLAKNMKVIPCKTELYAANGTKISVVGLTRVFFTVGGKSFWADMLISDDISELIIGMDWMFEHDCEWLCRKQRVVLDGVSVPLRTCPSQLNVRRIFVKESVVIPPDMVANVPVKMPVAHLRVPASDWLSDAKRVRPGLLVARTLLSHSSEYSSLAFLNMSGKSQALRSGLPLGRAVACPTECVRPLEADEIEIDESEDNVGNSGIKSPDNRDIEVTSQTGSVEPAGEDVDCSVDGVRQSEVGNSGVVEVAGQSSGSRSDDNSRRSSAWSEPAAQLLVSPSASMADSTQPANCSTLAGRRPSPREFLEVSVEDSATAAVAGPGVALSRTGLAGHVVAGPLNATQVAWGADAKCGHQIHFTIPKENEITGDSDLNVLAPSFIPNEQWSNEVEDCIRGDTQTVDTETKVKCASVITGNDVPMAEDFAHIQPVIDKLPDILTDEQRQQAVELIKKNCDIFSKHDFDVGCTNLLTASINTGDHSPIAEPLRRHARVHLDVIDETIDKMVDAGIVESCCSEWAANLVVVPKRDEQGKPTTPRITIDFRKLNAITYKDKYPIPNTKDCLQSLTNVQWLSSIDLSNSFFQVGIRPQDRDKTAFITRKGQFRLTRLAMGCCNSPSVFSRLMAMVVGGLKCCLAFIDDTIVFSSSFEQHLKDLQTLFDRFRWANLKLRPSKCRLFQNECEFLGHKVSSAGLSPQEKKVACVQAWKFPETITELRAFLGICSYYRSYVKGFASIAEPLTQCLRRDIPLERTPEREEAFRRLKKALTEAPILAVPRSDPECTWVVDSDASSYAAGAVLQQYQDGKLRVVEYASRVFNKAERNYCATRRELTAVVFALKVFRPYLLGTKFTLRVDNQAVSFLMKVKNPSGQAARYIDFLADYEFEISHRKGLSNANADSLSRMPPCSEVEGEPCEQCLRRVIGKHSVNVVQTRARSKKREWEGSIPSPVDEQPPESDSSTATGEEVSEPNEPNDETDGRPIRRRGKKKPLLQSIAPKAWEQHALGWTDDSMRKAQLTDPNIGPAMAWVETKTRPPWSAVDSQSPMLRALWRQYESLTIENGILYRNFYNTSGEVMHKQFILPHEFRVPFLELIHNDVAGHLKLAKCIPHVMRRSWWYGWKTDLNVFIRCCTKCESFCRQKPPRQVNLHPTHSGAPGEKVAIDLQGPFPASNGYKYVLTIICMFSKFAVCVPLRNKEAHTVAKAMVDHYFIKFGLCQVLLSDLGLEFENEVMAALTQSLGITKIRCTSYRPQSNAICEVLHRVLNTMFAKCVRNDQKDWSEWLQYITFCYNSAEHSSTGFPPFYIFFGRMPIWTIDLSLPKVEEGKSVPEYVADVTWKLQKANEVVRTNLSTAWHASSKWYNRKVKPKSFAEGDIVRVYYPRKIAGRCPKWQSFCSTEAVVTKRVNDATYLVTNKKWKDGKFVHVDKLKHVRQFE